MSLRNGRVDGDLPFFRLPALGFRVHSAGPKNFSPRLAPEAESRKPKAGPCLHFFLPAEVTVPEVHIRNLKGRKAGGRIKLPTTSQSSSCSLRSGATALNQRNPGRIGC